MTVISGGSAISEFDPKFTIINESADYYGRPGDTATFIVEAEGANLSYNWLCRASGASNFEYLTSSNATTNTLQVELRSTTVLLPASMATWAASGSPRSERNTAVRGFVGQGGSPGLQRPSRECHPTVYS